MRKEALFAIIIGLVLGLIITYGFYRTKLVFSPGDQTNKLVPSPSPKSVTNAVGNLVVHSPENEILTENQEVTIAGSTSPDSFVVIFVGDKETITTSDKSGNFSISHQLELGSNVITINSIDENGKVTTQERTVIYTNKPLEELKPQAEATESGTQTKK